MWLFTKFGFFSVVKKESDGADTLTIRARVKADLENLIKYYLIGEFKILTFPEADYRYRIIVPKEVFTKAIAEITKDINYENFKNEVYDLQGSGRANSYGKVWAELYKLQESK